MTSNVFTKKDILQNLASRGCFIDVYTLEAFFAKKKIEAIFEDSQGNEFYDNNALNLVLEGLFSTSQALKNAIDEPEQNPANTNIQNNTDATDIETQNIINNITLSDGTALKDKLEKIENITLDANNIQNGAPQGQVEISTTKTPSQIENTPATQTNSFDEFNSVQQNTPNSSQIENKPVVNEAADMFQSEDSFDIDQSDIMSSDLGSFDGGGNFDDISLLSESFEAQEKFRQYVMSEFSKNGGVDTAPQRIQSGNEFKLDISERTLNMIARTMAKKIAKYVGSIMAQDAKQSSKVAEFEEENRRLTQKARELEEQNRKLRLLLAESNKNLNSYKPSIFGLYKKVDPNAKKNR